MRYLYQDGTDTLLRILDPVFEVGSSRYDGYAVFRMSYYLLANTFYMGRHDNSGDGAVVRMERGMSVTLI